MQRAQGRRNGMERKVGNALDASNASKRNFTLRLAAIVNRRAKGIRDYSRPTRRMGDFFYRLLRSDPRVLPFLCDFLTDCVFWATFCSLPTPPSAPLAWRVLLN